MSCRLMDCAVLFGRMGGREQRFVACRYHAVGRHLHRLLFAIKHQMATCDGRTVAERLQVRF
jgi:hypothetical protein